LRLKHMGVSTKMSAQKLQGAHDTQASYSLLSSLNIFKR
jgi:hypothetical protein